MSPRTKWIGAGIAALLGAAATGYYLRDRSTERPNHRSIMRDGDFELRAYPPLIVAETVQQGPRQKALDKGFRVLGDYIFARARGAGLTDQEKIAVTAPVLSSPEGDGWRTRFLMPGKWSMKSLPEPAEGVAITELPARRMAAVRFAGKPDDAMLKRQERLLRGWMEEKGLRPAGPAEHGFYNSPFIPGPLRRNEVLIPLE